MFALNSMIELLLHESCQVLYQISWTAEVCPPRVAAGSGACVTPFWVESSPGVLCSVPGFDCGMVSCLKEIVSVGTCATCAQTQMKYKDNIKTQGTVTLLTVSFQVWESGRFSSFFGRLTGASSVARQRAPQLDLWEIEALLPVMEVSAKVETGAIFWVTEFLFQVLSAFL